MHHRAYRHGARVAALPSIASELVLKPFFKSPIYELWQLFKAYLSGVSKKVITVCDGEWAPQVCETDFDS